MILEGTPPPPEIDVELPGENGVDVYDFGDLASNETATETFTIRNEGSGVLKISEATCIGEQAKHFTVTPANPPGSNADWEVSAGNSMQFSVTFAPDDVGPREATLVLTTNDPDHPSYQIDLIGRAWGASVGKLGRVSYQELAVPHPAAEHDGVAYRFETMRDGTLTFQAAKDTGHPVSLGLYDSLGWRVANSTTVGSLERLDQQVKQGVVYYLKVVSESPRVDVKVANLVNHVGTTVWIYGTPGEDSFIYDASIGRRLDINGIEYSAAPSTVAEVIVDMGTGSDTIILDDSPGDDTLIVHPNTVSATGPGYVFDGTNFDTLLVYSRTGGHDVAHLYDSSEKDKFKAEPAEDYAKMYGGQIYARVKFFEEVHAYSSGGQDLARVWDTKGNDAFDGQKDLSRIHGAGYDVQMHSFQQVVARATQGGQDVATLVDSTLKDEFQGRSHKSRMFDMVSDGDIYDITVRAFDKVVAEAPNGGYDKAKLWDTGRSDDHHGNDHLQAAYVNNVPWAELSIRGEELDPLYEALAFEFVKAYRSSGDDTTDIAADVDFLILTGGWLE